MQHVEGLIRRRFGCCLSLVFWKNLFKSVYFENTKYVNKNEISMYRLYGDAYHYSDITWVLWGPKSPTIRLFLQHLVRTNNKNPWTLLIIDPFAVPNCYFTFSEMFVVSRTIYLCVLYFKFVLNIENMYLYTWNVTYFYLYLPYWNIIGQLTGIICEILVKMDTFVNSYSTRNYPCFRKCNVKHIYIYV